MHHKLVFHEVETVADCLEWTLYHLFFQLGTELGEIVHCFQRICCIWNAKWNLEFVIFDELSLEVMLFQHQELFDWLIAYSELQSGAHSGKFEELRSKMILNVSCRVGRFFADFTFRFFNLKENLILIGISDPEENKLDIIDIIFWSTEVIFSGLI